MSGKLYHQPLSAQAGTEGWGRELEPSYIDEAGWLDGRCSPADGGSYTLVVGGDQGPKKHQQLEFVVRVGLGDGIVSTAVSWRLSGLGEDVTVLPVTTKILEAEGDAPPRACLSFDGLELLLARQVQRMGGTHTVRMRLQRLDGCGASDACSLVLERTAQDENPEGGATLRGMVPLRELWAFESAALEWQGSGAHPEHALRYEIADEYLAVTQGLWDSWDDDAFVRDRESGRFFDRDKLHTLDHKGRFFQVAGPLNIQRSPQGQPVIFQAGSSDAGIGLAGKYADAVFTHSPSLEDTRSFLRQVKASAVAQGRQAGDVKIFPGIGPVVAATEEEAEAKYRAIRELLTIEEALAYLGRFFDHHDFSQYPLDAPFPELGEIGRNSFRSTTDRIKANAKAKGQTLREVALEVATPRTQFVGTGERIADEIIRWVDEGAADGFILGFPVLGQGLDDFIEFVIPVLEARGRYQRELPGQTLAMLAITDVHRDTGRLCQRQRAG